MSQKPIKCPPVFCQVCNKIIERRPNEQPSIYLRHKYHVDNKDCAKTFRNRQATAQAAKQKAAKRIKKLPSETSLYMIMPKITNRTTKYN